MENLLINYILTTENGSKHTFKFQLDRKSLDLIGFIPETLPSWTQLGFHQCKHCPLSADEYPYCPVASNLVGIVTSFEGIPSYEKMHVKVITDERIISHNTTAQIGISSMMGFVMATAGCPHTAFFKPMARFHLVLASDEETAYRATSMYLLSQYFKNRDGRKADLELTGLMEIYENIQIVNIAIAERLRAAAKEDSSINALILLDIRAWELRMEIEKSLEDIRYMFQPYLT
ncbi:DUF6901 family protein [Candidatus Latescibacterota bacterium]